MLCRLIGPVVLLAFGTIAYAQETPCGIRSVSEGISAFYPPIARAAHISGDVVLIATFKPGGEVQDVRVVSGPEMLKKSAVEFVQAWHANPDEDTRSCSVVIRYVISGDTGCMAPPTPSTEQTGRINPQRYNVVAQALMICDGANAIHKRRKFLGIF